MVVQAALVDVPMDHGIAGVRLEELLHGLFLHLHGRDSLAPRCSLACPAQALGQALAQWQRQHAPQAA